MLYAVHTASRDNNRFVMWCARPDSNRHAVKRQDLNLVRLPISPLAHCGVHCTEEHATVRALFVFQIAADSFGQCAAGSVVFSPRNFP